VIGEDDRDHVTGTDIAVRKGIIGENVKKPGKKNEKNELNVKI